MAANAELQRQQLNYNHVVVQPNPNDPDTLYNQQNTYGVGQNYQHGGNFQPGSDRRFNPYPHV